MKLHRYAHILRLIDVIRDCLDVKVPDEGARRPITSRIRNIFRHEYRTHIFFSMSMKLRRRMCIYYESSQSGDLRDGSDLRIRVTEDKSKSREKRARETG